MHIVMLNNATAPDKLGGLERYVRELAASLVRSGTEVTIVAKRVNDDYPSDETAADGVRVLRYGVPTKKDPTFALRYPGSVMAGVRRALRQAGPRSVLHAHFPVPALVPVLDRQPFVYTLHAPVYRELLGERQGTYVLPRPVQSVAEQMLKRAEAVVVRRASHIITLSQFMRGEVATLDPAAGDRVQILAGGIDTDHFVPAPAEPRRDGPVLFTARRLVPRTGVAQLVAAMPAILAAHPGCRLVIAGDGLQRDHIAAEIERLGVGGSVSMVGRISNGELLVGYQQADLVVTPTQELEGFGLATAEALACGTPCLVTPAGANPELVSGLSSKLVAADVSPVAMAAAVISLLGDPELLATLKPRCRPAVDPAMGWPAIAEQHRELYATIAGRTRSLSTTS